MAANEALFAPRINGGVVITTATSGTSTTSALPSFTPPPTAINVFNGHIGIVIVNFGASTVQASATNGVPIAPNGFRIFPWEESMTHIAAITFSGTGTSVVFATVGDGAAH